MPAASGKLPRSVRVFTRFHRHAVAPNLNDLKDFTETFLFRANAVHESTVIRGAPGFWLVHCPTDQLWLLTQTPGINTTETVLAWCTGSNELRAELVQQRLVMEWCHACRRHRAEVGFQPTDVEKILKPEQIRWLTKGLKTGNTPLHDAASDDDRLLAAFLCSRGDDINLPNLDLRTPLHLAAAAAAVRVVELLLRKHASRDFRDTDGATPLELAEASGNAAVIKLLQSAEVIESAEDLPAPTASEVWAHLPEQLTESDVDSWKISRMLLSTADHWRRDNDLEVAEIFYRRAASVPKSSLISRTQSLFGVIRCHIARDLVDSESEGLQHAIGDGTWQAEILVSAVLKHAKSTPVRRNPAEALHWLKLSASLPVSDALRSEVCAALAGHFDEHGEAAKAIEKLSEAIATPNPSKLALARFLIARGAILYREGATADAISDLERVGTLRLLFKKTRAEALIELSKCYEELGRPAEVIRLLKEAVALEGVTAGEASASLHNYGVRCNLRGHPERAFEYFSAVISIGNATPWIMANATVNRGCRLGFLQEYAAASADFKAAIAMPDIPVDILRRAYFNLAHLRWLQNHYSAAVQYFGMLIAVDGPVDSLLLLAYCKRANAYCELKQKHRALQDLSQIVPIPEGTSEDLSDLLLWTGITFQACDRLAQADEHFSRLVSLESATVEMRARAKWGLGSVRIDQNRPHEALTLLLDAEHSLHDIGREDLLRFLRKSIDKAQQAVAEINATESEP